MNNRSPRFPYAAAALWMIATSPFFASQAIGAENQATLTRPNQVIVQNEHMTMKEGFGAHFWLTDSDRFYLNWVHADTRNLTPVVVTHRNVPLFIAVFIVDPGIKKVILFDGKEKLTSDVTYDFQILKPDGSQYPNGAGRNITGWTKRPPPPHLVQLLYGRATITFELIDPIGEYTVNIVVHDNVRKVDIPLQRKVQLVE